MEITKGKWEVNKGMCSTIVNVGAGTEVCVLSTGRSLTNVCNATLIADAGNTYQATNKLPSELAKANKELLEALKIAKLCSNHEDAKEAYGHIDTHWTNVIDNTIKKHTNHA